MHGRSFAATLAALITLALPAAASADIVVTVNDAGDAPDLATPGCDSNDAIIGDQCTLRAALSFTAAAPNTGVRDFIQFHPSVTTVSAGATALTVADPTVIDGGAGGVTLAGGGQDHAGLVLAVGAGSGGVEALETVVDQLTIEGFDGVGIVIDAQGGRVSDSTVSSNLGHGIAIGEGSTDAFVLRTAVSGNGGDGVAVSGDEAIVGGSAGQGNVIGGNSGAGVRLLATGSALVNFNRIGTDAAGAASVPNDDGVVVDALSSDVEDNLVSGNDGSGIVLHTCPDVIDNVVGLDAAGTGDLGNDGDGIEVDVTCLLTNNTVSGNGQNGVRITGDGVTFQGGRVGTGQAGTGAVGNAGHGVLVSGAGAVLLGNLIRANGADGVATTGAGTARLTANLIDGNGGLGIDAGDDGVSTGGLPVLSAVEREGGQLRVKGTLADGGYTVELYANAACDPSGYGEGATLLGSAPTAVLGGVLAVTIPADVPIGTVVSATVTEAGTTSEFSNCATAQDAGVNPPPGGTTPPPGGTTPPPGAPQADPQSTITSPRGTVKARRLKRIRGTSQDAARVDIAVIRVKGRRCFALTRRGTFARRTGPRRCSPRAFFKANGTATWSFRLKRRFPPGRYRIYSRATATDGTREAPPARVRVRVRR